jgi:hypothetical protein
MHGAGSAKGRPNEEEWRGNYERRMEGSWVSLLRTIVDDNSDECFVRVHHPLLRKDGGRLNGDLELEGLAKRPPPAIALRVVLPPFALKEGFEEADVGCAVLERATRGRGGLMESEVATKGAHVDELRKVVEGGGGRRRGTRVKVERFDGGEGVASLDTDTLDGDDGTRRTFAEEGGGFLGSRLEEPEVLLHPSVDAHLPLLLARLLLFYVTRKRSLHLPAVPATDEVDHRRLFRHRAKVVVLELVLLLELDEGLAMLLGSADLDDGVATETAC